MARYISKLQYKTYETSEFTSIAPRTFEEVRELIHNFPWEAERPLTPVGLTGPSVTIEDGFGNYLKLSLYYNNKFCFYFLSTEGKLYRKIILKIAESEEVIAQFFQNEVPLDTFQLQAGWSKQTKHFETNHFEYTRTSKRTRNFLSKPMLSFWAYLILILLISSNGRINREFVHIFFSFLIFYHIFIVRFYIISINYWLYCDSLFLKVTKTNNTFYFGSMFDPIEYNKLEIKEINIYKDTARSTSLANCAVYEIIFLNNDSVTFPSLLIDAEDFYIKFRLAKINIISRWFPWIKIPMQP